MRLLIITTILLVAAPVYASGLCSNATLNGTYSVKIEGTMEGPNGTSNAAALNLSVFDGQGLFETPEGVLTIDGQHIINLQQWGTYEINKSCTGFIELHTCQPDGTEEVEAFFITISPLGFRFWAQIIEPLSLATGGGARISFQNDLPNGGAGCL